MKAEGTFNSACLMENRGFRRKKNKVVIADVFFIACVTRRIECYYRYIYTGLSLSYKNCINRLQSTYFFEAEVGRSFKRHKLFDDT